MPIKPENKKRYPKSWKSISEYIRYVRANNRCEFCGVENGKINPRTGSKVVLTTAHLFDSRPENCFYFNLAALCQQCHNSLDAQSRAKGRKSKRI